MLISSFFTLLLFFTPLITVSAVISNPNQVSPGGSKSKKHQLPHRLISELHYQHKLAKRYRTGKNSMILLRLQTFLPQQSPDTTTKHNCLKTNEREPQSAEDQEKSTNRLLLCKTQNDPRNTAKHHFLTGSAGSTFSYCRDRSWVRPRVDWVRRATCPHSEGSPSPVPKVYVSDAFTCLSSQAHIVSSTSRAAAPHGKGAEPQTTTGTKPLPGLAAPIFFK